MPLIVFFEVEDWGKLFLTDAFLGESVVVSPETLEPSRRYLQEVPAAKILITTVADIRSFLEGKLQNVVD